MKRWLFVAIILVFVLTGCTSETSNSNPDDVLTFKSEDAEFVGIKGRIGIYGPDFVAKKGNKYMWHFWGSKEELQLKKFKVEATNVKTGEKSKALVNGLGSDSAELLWEREISLGGPMRGADAHIPSGMELPSSGVWQLDVYFDDELFGSFNINVK